MPTNTRRFGLFVVCISLVSVIVFYISLTSGSYGLSATETLRTLFRLDVDPKRDLVVFDFRLPRIVIGAIVGFGLGIAGAVLQGITRNPLADPGILGINAGAGAASFVFCFLLKVKSLM